MAEAAQRFHLHFIPTSSSWLNMVERWFREITDKRIRRGVFKSVEQLIGAIRAYHRRAQQGPQAIRLDGQSRGNSREGTPSQGRPG